MKINKICLQFYWWRKVTSGACNIRQNGDATFAIFGLQLSPKSACKKQYYYHKTMHDYGDNVKSTLYLYQEAIEIIAKEVKSFGGDGKIHGNIVDIDYWNHIEFSPKDGQLRFYFATSTSNRYYYDSVEQLLIERNKILLPKYREKRKQCLLLTSAEKDQKLLANLTSTNNARHTSATTMYGASFLLKKYQYTYYHNLIRTWDLVFLKKLSQYPIKAKKML